MGNFGLQYADDNSIRRAIMQVAPLLPRHYVLMEVKQNLVAADREANLKLFKQPHFKQIAHVMMGEPTKDFKEKVHIKLLEDKQAKSDVEWKKEKAEKERKKLQKKKAKEAEERRQKAMEEAKKRKEAADAKKKELADKKKKEEEDKKKEEEDKKKAEEGAEKKEDTAEKKEGEAEKK